MLKFATGIAGVRVFLQDLIDSQSKKGEDELSFLCQI